MESLNSSLSEIYSFLPVVSLIAGFGGSLHCVGMCGGLVTASCERSQDVFRYQLGRLLGYLLLGLVAGVIGGALNLQSLHPNFTLIPALMIGGLFIYWGIQNYRGKKAELPMPRLMSQFYQRLWKGLVHQNTSLSRAFITGLISIFLPCGLLYGVALGTVALQHTHQALLSMFFFWLGTVPSMVVAPTLIRRLLSPMKSRLPKTFAIALMLVGVLTISFRVEKLYKLNHSSSTGQEISKPRCH